MLQTDNVGQIDLTVLAENCAAETRKFLQGLLSDAQYCYELFRRALADKNQQAYAKVVEIYSRSMDKRIRKKVRFPLVDEDLEIRPAPGATLDPTGNDSHAGDKSSTAH